MRPIACLGMIVLVLLAGCETVPGNVKIDVDGRTIEFKKKPVPNSEAASAEPR